MISKRKLINIASTTHSYHFACEGVDKVAYLLAFKFQADSILLLTFITMLHTRSPELIHLIFEILYHLTHISHFS